MEESQVIKLYEKMSELNQRMAKIEGILEGRTHTEDELKNQLAAYDERIKILENNVAKVGGGWNTICVGAGVAAFIWEVIKHLL